MTYSSYRAPTNFRNVPSPKPRRQFHVFGILAVVIISFIGIKIDLSVRAADHAAALAAAQHVQDQETEFKLGFNQVANNNSQISFSVAAISPNTNASQQLGTSLPMPAASVGKLLTASLFLHQVETGHASLSETIGGNNAKQELQLLINQSDDTAWQVLNDRLGHSGLNAYARGLGLSSYSSDADSINAADVAKLLQKLWAGELLNQTHTQMLLGWMQKTNYESFISPAVPAGYKIYHKVGLVNDNVNDAAIISNGKKTLILVIFTDGHGVMDWDNRATLIQQITRSATNAYFN